MSATTRLANYSRKDVQTQRTVRVANKINRSTSVLQKASNAAFKASRGVSRFSVSAKHLSNARGRHAKFSTSSQATIRQWIKAALNSKSATFHPNKDGSYYILHRFGKAIGSRGEKTLKVVFGSNGKIWTAFPVR